MISCFLSIIKENAQHVGKKLSPPIDHYLLYNFSGAYLQYLELLISLINLIWGCLKTEKEVHSFQLKLYDKLSVSGYKPQEESLNEDHKTTIVR